MQPTFFIFLFSILIFSSFANASPNLIPNAFGTGSPSECTLNTLNDLIHEFEHNQAYIQIHTDDGIHPENTGQGDLLTPGEIRGDIGPGDADTIFEADIDVHQMVLHGISNTTPWDSVNSTATVVFNTGHHSNHIDYSITGNATNVVGIHIHAGAPGENNSVHYVDIIPTDTHTRIDLDPVIPLAGEIEVDDLCPGGHHHDDGEDDPHHNNEDPHHGEEFVNDGGNGESDGHEEDDLTKLHIHLGEIDHTGPHVLNIFGDPAEDDSDMAFDTETGIITGTWDDDDENTVLSDSERTKKLSETLASLCSENLYLNVHTTGFGSGAIRGQILSSEQNILCDHPSLISGRVISDTNIVLEFDKPVVESSLSFTSVEVPTGHPLTIDSLSTDHSSYGHGIVIIETVESLEGITGNGQLIIGALTDIFGELFDVHDNPLPLINLQGNSSLVLSHESPNLILTENSTFNEIILEPGIESILDLKNSRDTHTMNNKTTVVIPSNMTIIGSQNTANEVRLIFPPGLEITGDSDVFDGFISLPSIRDEMGSDTCLPEFPESASRVASCIELGLSNNELTLSQPAKIVFPNEGLNVPYYGVGLNSERILIRDQCDAVDKPEVDGTEISSSGPIRECFIDDGNHMVLWITHMTSFGTISPEISEGRSASASGGGGGGGSWRSSLTAPHLVMYNTCNEEFDGVVRIVAFNKPGNDLSVKVYNNDFTNYAVEVSDEVSYLSYIDRSNSDYEYSVFDARFPNDLDSFWMRLYVNDDMLQGLGHYVKLPRDSCVGYEEPIPLKDNEASILKPIEPLETPAGYDINYVYLKDKDSIVDPEPAAAVVDPEPAAAVVDPEPTAAVVDPEPAAAVVDPEPAAAVVDPEPAAAVVDPEPAAAVVDPELDQVQVNHVFDSSKKTPQCGQGTKLVNNICQITATQIDANEENSKKQTGMFENFMKWLGLI